MVYRMTVTWLEMGHTSTATPLFLDISLANGWRRRANPWPMREVLNKRASNKFWSTSVPSRSACRREKSECMLLWDVFITVWWLLNYLYFISLKSTIGYNFISLVLELSLVLYHCQQCENTCTALVIKLQKL